MYLFWNPKSEELLPAVKAKITAKSELLSKLYGKNELALGYLTLVDLKVAEISYYVEKIFPDVVDNFPFRKRTRDAVNSIPQTYYKS